MLASIKRFIFSTEKIGYKYGCHLWHCCFSRSSVFLLLCVPNLSIWLAPATTRLNSHDKHTIECEIQLIHFCFFVSTLKKTMQRTTYTAGPNYMATSVNPPAIIAPWNNLECCQLCYMVGYSFMQSSVQA